MHLKLEPVEVIVNKIFELEGEKYLELNAGEKYGIHNIPYTGNFIPPIEKGEQLTAMIGMSGIPDFIGDKPYKENVCTVSLSIYSVWDKYSRVIYHDTQRIYK